MLDNYKRKRKKFIAPFNYTLQDKGWEVHYKWISHQLIIVPEIIWIDILNNALGESFTSQFLSHLCDVVNKYDKPFGAFNNSFHKISNKSISELKLTTDFKNFKIYIEPVITDFLTLFPNNPLNKIFEVHHPYNIGSVGTLRKSIEILNDKDSLRCTIAFSHIIYSSAVGKILNLLPILSNPSEILKYPTTEKSEVMAACIRSSIKSLYGFLLDEEENEWNKDFWNTCRTLSNWKIKNIIMIS